MKVICDGLDLSEAVLKVSKALAVKSPNPVLEGIKITAKQDSLTLIATDMELTIEKTIKADVLMEGETVVVGKYFVDFAKKLEKEQVELSHLYDSQLQIKYSDSESELQIYPTDSFPEFKREEVVNFFQTSQASFRNIIEKTVLSCSTDDSRPVLKGCLFEIENGVLTTVALDGFRMSIVKAEVLSSGNFKAVIPAKTLLEIVRLLSDNDTDVKIYIQNNSLYAEVDNTVIYSRLIEGEFVKYNHILPNSFANRVTVSKNALLNSIERASIVARNDRFNVIKFDIKEDLMTVSAKSEVGNVNENVNIDLMGKDMLIAFNGKYIIEYLKIINDEYVTLNINSPIESVVLNSIGNENFTYLILPVRINA